jgi:F420-dependent oxidoreductase-like protein
VDISIMIEGQDGLTWDRWRALVRSVEELGFAGLYRSDHFTNARGPDKDSLELWVSLTWLADNTSRIRFGPLVCPMSFRHPAMVARQASALHVLSGGRMSLGLGAGWQEREHEKFGFELGDIAARMARLEEGLQVATQLLRSEDPVTFEGRYFRVKDAELLPRPQRPGGPPVMVGGNGPKRTLPLTARFADIWNGIMVTPEAYAERSRLLDDLLEDAGRKPSDLKRTLMTGCYFGADDEALAARLDGLRRVPQLSEADDGEILERLRSSGAVAGTPDQVAERLEEYEASGVEELMLQWLDMDDLEGLAALGKALL